MPYRIDAEQRPAEGALNGTVYILEETQGAARAEIWPAFGFNCYRWLVARSGRTLDLLYADPQLFNNSKPTRSGIPILFPFPNRIRDGRFTWHGRTYRLPPNDSSRKNAIHGFACRRPWRVVDRGANDQEAWLTGEFRASTDAPDDERFWPADYRLRITYRLQGTRLRIEARVENPDTAALPFGLGYHPYFRVPFTPESSAADCSVEAPASQYWELLDSLPTGKVLPVDAARDLQRPRPYPDLNLDDVLTGLDETQTQEDLCWRGTVRDAASQAELRLFCSPAFRELVAFTPSHRRAVCLEPYTCTTDAINLQDAGVEAGWQVLPSGGTWQGVVELRV